MLPITIQQDEDDFMNALLSGMSATNANDASKPVQRPFASNPSHPTVTATSTTATTRPSTSQPSPTRQKTQKQILELLDGAEDWSWDADLESDDLSTSGSSAAAQRLPERVVLPAAKEQHVLDPCTRCVVLSVEESTQGRPQKTLTVRFDGSRSEDHHQVILQGDWYSADVHIGDIVNVIGSFEENRQPTDTTSSAFKSSIIISIQHNLLILHPDLLLTATAIANSVQCQRRPIIQSLLHSSSDVTPALVWGNMLHEVMQACLAEGRWDDKFVNDKTDEVVRQGMESLIRLNVSLDVAKIEIRKRAVGLQGFSRRFIGEVPKDDAVLSDIRAGKDQSTKLAISGLHDTEEDIWSPRYGLKGKLDASVQVMLKETKGLWEQTKKTSMPFEIKTGMSKGGIEHRAQTMLYTLLMEERYGTDVPAGLLYYTQSDEVIRVGAARNELRALIQNRNNMATHTMKRASNNKKAADDLMEIDFLPPTQDDERTCGRCYAVDGCMLYRKAVERVEDSNSEIQELYNYRTAHLTDAQCNFFKEWEELISLEEQESLRFRKQLWTMGAEQREKTGRCFANMVIASSPPSDVRPDAGPGASKIHRYTYTFLRKPPPQTRGSNLNSTSEPPAPFTRASSTMSILQKPFNPASSLTPSSPSAASSNSLLNGHLVVGDAVTISIEPNLLALARGFILQLFPQRVVVGLDHALDVDSLLARTNTKTSSHENDGKQSRVVFRIDKDEMTTGIGRIRNNLANLFYRGGDQRRLELVVDLKRPEFDDINNYLSWHKTGSASKSSRPVKSVLNESQRYAVAKALSARDYAILLGMPGTGKTTTIAEIIKELVKRGKTVLLSSYTHSAVDNILMKLSDVDFDILRLGNPDKIHPEVHKMTLAARPTTTSVEQLERQLLTPPVVATTCLSIDHTLFSRRTFDVCIVDEASQVTLPTCLGPLRFADKFILVGDHFQLPPLVKSTRAKQGGFDVSLFRRLSDAHPHAVVELAHQYRMNEDIMKVSNTLIYQGRLKCGDEAVAKGALTLPNPNGLNNLHVGEKVPCSGNECWIKDLADPSRRVVFVDTDLIPARESRVGALIQNEVEASLVQQLVRSLVLSGVEESQIGVLSLLRQQIKLLSSLLEPYKKVEVLTADRSQGRDKDCIIISMVRSNDSNSIGDLLKDWRRLNVSFTRARSKLVIFGSRRTLNSTDVLRDFFQLMERESWIYQLPKEAHTSHIARQDTCMDTTEVSEVMDVKPSMTITKPESVSAPSVPIFINPRKRGIEVLEEEAKENQTDSLEPVHIAKKRKILTDVNEVPTAPSTSKSKVNSKPSSNRRQETKPQSKPNPFLSKATANLLNPKKRSTMVIELETETEMDLDIENNGKNIKPNERANIKLTKKRPLEVIDIEDSSDPSSSPQRPRKRVKREDSPKPTGRSKTPKPLILLTSAPSIPIGSTNLLKPSNSSNLPKKQTVLNFSKVSNTDSSKSSNLSSTSKPSKSSRPSKPIKDTKGARPLNKPAGINALLRGRAILKDVIVDLDMI